LGEKTRSGHITISNTKRKRVNKAKSRGNKEELTLELEIGDYLPQKRGKKIGGQEEVAYLGIRGSHKKVHRALADRTIGKRLKTVVHQRNMCRK